MFLLHAFTDSSFEYLVNKEVGSKRRNTEKAEPKNLLHGEQSQGTKGIRETSQRGIRIHIHSVDSTRISNPALDEPTTIEG